MRLPCALISLGLLACGGSGSHGTDRKPRPTSDPGYNMTETDDFELMGALVATEDAAKTPYFELSKTYQLSFEDKAAYEVESRLLESNCGGSLSGPFYELKRENDLLLTTNIRTTKDVTDDHGFPGVVDPGTYQFTIVVYSDIACDVSIKGSFRPRTDLAFLEPGEWDQRLSGAWAFTNAWGEQHTWQMDKDSFHHKVYDTNKKTITDVIYEPVVDGSQLPSRITLTVSKVSALAEGSPKLRYGNEVRCIYRTFLGYEDKESLWLTCGAPGQDHFPAQFSYPAHEFHRP